MSDLREAAAVFTRQPTARIISAVLAAALAGRALLGGWSWWELVVPAVVVALEPFTEWAIHVFLLHFRPRTIAGRRIDPLVARKHRAHHADPRDLDLVFVPIPVLVGSLAVAVVGFLALAPTLGRALTGIASVTAMLLVYEWTHYLIHTSYRPRTRAYRYVWRAHRLHHFRNEHYWFGVTVHLADHVLGTFPGKDAVPASPTARTLGVEA